MTELDDIGECVRQILAEGDPQRQRALSRRLRCAVWDGLTARDRKTLCDAGVDLSGLKRGLREV